jgi:hypothetical protein
MGIYLLGHDINLNLRNMNDMAYQTKQQIMGITSGEQVYPINI